MDKDEIENARQIRTNCKTKITKFSTFVEKCLSDNHNISVEEIQLRLKKLEETWIDYDKAQLILEIKTPTPNRETERVEFENNYFKWVSLATKLINERSNAVSVQRDSVTENDEIARQKQQIAQLEAELRTQRDSEIIHLRELAVSRVSNTTSETNAIRTHFPLPKLDLPTFSGKYEEWLGFKDTFNAIIHNDPTIPKVQKLRYLKSYVKGNASQVIENIEISEASYDEAYKLLEDRYDNKRVIVQNHMMSLFDLKTPGKESASCLRNLLDSVSRHIRALKILNEKTESWDTPLVCLVSSKLDRDSRREWEKSLKGNKMPTFKLLIEFLRERCQLLEALNPVIIDQSKQISRTFNKISTNNENKNLGKTLINTQTNAYCKLCKEEHFIQNCEKFLELKPNDRLQMVKVKGLCFNCLRGNHLINDCKSRNCTICNKRHHTLLHLEIQPNNNNTNKDSENRETNVGKNLHINDSSSVILSTAIINILDNQGNKHNCRIILDSGSQPNIMTKFLADKLNLNKKRINSAIEGINSTELNSFEWVSAKLESKHTNYNAELSFLILPTITSEIPSVPINKNKLNIPSYINLADPNFDKPAPVDALIGAELFYELLGTGKINLSAPHTSLQSTKLGWIVTGKTTKKQAQAKFSCNLVRDGLSKQLENFWKIEEDREIKHVSEEEIKCEKHFLENIQRDSSGKYTVRLPFNGKIEELGDSYETARKRFFILERKLSKNSEVKEKYHKFMQQYEELNHMEISKGKKDEGYYMPHQAVIRESSITTDLRVVFDGSSKTSTGISLNEAMMIGPIRQDNIITLMIRFRSHPIALSADVEKMYRQFWVHEDDQKFQKILWRYDENKPIKIYQLKTITYGTSSAPYLAIRCLEQLSIDGESSFPEAARVLREDFYVDDLLTGVESLEEARKLQSDLIELTATAGLNLRKWRSNCPEITEEKSRDAGILKLDMDHTSKTLGVRWDSLNDNLFFEVDQSLKEKVISKRSMLSQIAKLYDPLGIIAPVVVYAKIKMQDLWKSQSSWDDPVPPHILSEYEQYQDQLHLLNDWRLERAVKQQGAAEMEIHGFSDASEKAYGASVYIRTKVDGNYRCNLLCAKSRVAPVKTITLPRLELCGAVLLSHLIKTVKESLKIKVEQVKLWSDSTIVLNWINSSPHEFNTFVGNRVSIIQSLTKTEMWGHVVSKQNPADFVSRGQLPAEFVNNDLWKFGPEWLLLPEHDWPNGSFKSMELPERKKSVILITKTNEEKFDLLKKFSSLKKLIRVISYCLRFVDKSRGNNQYSGQLSVSELNRALEKIIIHVQGQEFAEEITAVSGNKELSGKSKLLRLSPIWKEGLLRVGGRIKNSELAYHQQHPILLPKNNPFTDLVIRDCHESNMHSGINATLYTVREKYWIVDGRSEVRRILNRCVKCFRVKPKETSYIMGDLPKARVTTSRPFESSGVDYCGPFYVKEKRLRNRGKVKVYAAVFVCLSTKAVHIELIGDLSTELFLAGLRRFIARRGKCRVLFSDNGTNFVGAKNELKELYSLLNDKKHNEIVHKDLSEKGIEWHFSPPRTPHFGGIWEAAVKSLKNHLYKTIGETLFTYEELYTYMCEVEGILNSRPLTPISFDPNDFQVLTPGHFLIGEPISSIPSLDYSQVPNNRLSSWQHIQKVKGDFWKRWAREYLNELNVRSKWCTGSKELIKEGMLVVIRDDNLPPLRWNLGRIIKVIPGEDGIIRVVEIKTQSGVFSRGVKKISPLPIEINND